jgi:hypothetical protein
VIDASANAQLKSGIDYVVLLTVNGNAANATINGINIAYTFAPRIDSLGIRHGINDGIVGIGGNNAAAQIDNVVVQAPPGAITFDRLVDFGSASQLASLFGAATSGTWQLTPDGRYVGTATSANAPAVSLIGYPVSPGSLVSISTTLRTAGLGGVVFDYQGPSLYKFAMLSVDTEAGADRPQHRQRAGHRCQLLGQPLGQHRLQARRVAARQPGQGVDQRRGRGEQAVQRDRDRSAATACCSRKGASSGRRRSTPCR